MSRTIAALAVATLVAGAATAAMAFARTVEWASAAWFELLLTVGAVTALVTAGMLAVTLITTGVLELAAAIAAPAQPPGLVRIARIMELYAAERQVDAGVDDTDLDPPRQGSSAPSA